MTTAIAGYAERLANRPRAQTTRYALLGHPNTGRTTLFNRLCGLRSQTANYPGTREKVTMLKSS